MNQVTPINTNPVDIQAPDITRWQAGNTGVDFVWQFDSGKPGPNVMVQSLTHGNEICGAIVMEWFLSQGFKPQKGVLTMTFGNLAAFARWDPANPGISRYTDEDFNRVWSDEYLKSNKNSAELERARLLLPFVDSADYLLDIHSMHEPCAPLMVCGVTGEGADKAVELSKRLGIPECLMYDTGHPSGKRMIERPHFADPNNPKTAILIECGQHWEKSSVDVARQTMLRFLIDREVISHEAVASHLNASLQAKSHKVVKVTEAVVAKSSEFSFVQPFKGLEVIPKKGDPIAKNGDETVVAPYDNTVLVMPSVSKQWKIGTTMVRLGQLM
ncbi:succinylglutamate desuccinylase/aspartoacylase domain-containing protein [Orrella daihaiensis]|uniref:Succinylglutamate desuccinylase/aspartoacylase family protein n=1 Tax=Orrella daihaiensis TaxID=2782176 RepID=A0ABY4AN97_9BURK|nr:succinylglutamate desuccinylase/aspartoacylase family protein [Orrella daihaiensis]UOD49519.1 succinylglutamate desuccinylase/aspartoacylase family protein [Orrella daihaiensis]